MIKYKMARRTRKRTRRTRKITRRTRKRTNRNRRTYRRKSKTNQKRRVGGKTRNIRKSIKGGGVGKGLQEAVVGATKALKPFLKRIPTDKDLPYLMELSPSRLLNKLKEFGLEYDKKPTSAEINLIGVMIDYFKRMSEKELIRLGLILGEQGVHGLLQVSMIKNFLSKNSQASPVIIKNSHKNRPPVGTSSEGNVMVGGSGSGSLAVDAAASSGPVGLTILVFLVICCGCACVCNWRPQTAIGGCFSATCDAISKCRGRGAARAARDRYLAEVHQEEIERAMERLRTLPGSVYALQADMAAEAEAQAEIADAQAKIATARKYINEKIVEYNDERNKPITIIVGGPRDGNSTRCQVSTMHTVRELGEIAAEELGRQAEELRRQEDVHTAEGEIAATRRTTHDTWGQNSRLFKGSGDGESVAMVADERLGKYDLETENSVQWVISDEPDPVPEPENCAICLRVIVGRGTDPEGGGEGEGGGEDEEVQSQHCRTTACGHSFCTQCIMEWLHDVSQRGDCPLCKKVLVGESDVGERYILPDSLAEYHRDPRSMMKIGKNPVGSIEWMGTEKGQAWKRTELGIFEEIVGPHVTWSQTTATAAQQGWLLEHLVLLKYPNLIPEIEAHPANQTLVAQGARTRWWPWSWRGAEEEVGRTEEEEAGGAAV